MGRGRIGFLLREGLVLAVTVAVLSTGLARVGEVVAQPGKKPDPAHALNQTIDFAIDSDLSSLLGDVRFGDGADAISTTLGMDAKGKLIGRGTFRSAELVLSGKTRCTRKGQTFVLKGSATVNGKSNTKFKSKGRVAGDALDGTYTVTDKARGVAQKGVAAQGALPPGANGWVRIRLDYVDNVPVDNSRPRLDGFADSDVGRFPFTKVVTKVSGKSGGDDQVSIKAKGQGASVKIRGTNDGTTLTGTATGRVGPYKFRNVAVEVPLGAGQGPRAIDVGKGMANVQIEWDGTLPDDVQINLSNGAVYKLAAGTQLRRSTGELLFGSARIEVETLAAGRAPAIGDPDLTCSVSVFVNDVENGASELTRTTFDPPGRLCLPPGLDRNDRILARGPIDDLLLGGTGGGGGGDTFATPDGFRFRDFGASSSGNGSSDLEFSVLDELSDPSNAGIDILNDRTGTFTFSSIDIDGLSPEAPDTPGITTFPVPGSAASTTGFRLDCVVLRTKTTGRILAARVFGNPLTEADGPALIGKAPDGTDITVEVSSFAGDPIVEVSDVVDNLLCADISWTNDSDSGTDRDVSPSGGSITSEDDVPGGTFAGPIEVRYVFKTGTNGARDFLQRLRRVVGDDGRVDRGPTEFGEPDDVATFTVHGWTSATSQLASALGVPPGLDAVTGLRELGILAPCPEPTKVVGNDDTDGLTVFGGDLPRLVGQIDLPGRPDGLAPTARRVYAVSDGRLSCVDPTGGHVVGSRKIKGIGGGVAVNPQGDCVLVTNDRGELLALDAVTLRDKWKIDALTGGFTPDIDVSADGGKAVLTQPLENQLYVIDLIRRRIDRVIALPGAQAAEFSPDGKTIGVTAGPDVVFIDAESGARFRTESLGGFHTQLSWAPNGRFVGVGNFELDRFSTVSPTDGVIDHSEPLDGANTIEIVTVDDELRALITAFTEETVDELILDDDGLFGDRVGSGLPLPPIRGTYFFDEFESFR